MVHRLLISVLAPDALILFKQQLIVRNALQPCTESEVSLLLSSIK